MVQTTWIEAKYFHGYVKQVRKHNCEIPEPANLITYAPDDKPI